MKPEDIFVGRKVWIKPNPLHAEKYEGDYIETEVTEVGLKLFSVKDDIRPRVKYHIKTLEEATHYHRKAYILLSIDGVEDFDRREQLIIKIRKYFNSRMVYNESEENLNNVIELLQL